MKSIMEITFVLMIVVSLAMIVYDVINIRNAIRNAASVRFDRKK